MEQPFPSYSVADKLVSALLQSFLHTNPMCDLLTWIVWVKYCGLLVLLFMRSLL